MDPAAVLALRSHASIGKNSTSLLLITLNAVADRLSTPTYTRDIAEMLPRFFNVDVPGGVLHFANAGQLGTADLNNLLWPKGSILQMQPGSTPPAGGMFTKRINAWVGSAHYRRNARVELPVALVQPLIRKIRVIRG